MAPPSSGGSTVGEALNILNAATSPRWTDLKLCTAISRPLRWPSPTEPLRRRPSDFVDVPLTELLSQGFADERACLIGLMRRSSRCCPGLARRRVRAMRAAAVANARGGLRRASRRLTSRPGTGGERCLLHAHDRTDRRIGHRRAGPWIPAEQRVRPILNFISDPRELRPSEPSGAGKRPRSSMSRPSCSMTVYRSWRSARRVAR